MPIIAMIRFFLSFCRPGRLIGQLGETAGFFFSPLLWAPPLKSGVSHASGIPFRFLLSPFFERASRRKGNPTSPLSSFFFFPFFFTRSWIAVGGQTP